MHYFIVTALGLAQFNFEQVHLFSEGNFFFLCIYQFKFCLLWAQGGLVQFFRHLINLGNSRDWSKFRLNWKNKASLFITLALAVKDQRSVLFIRREFRWRRSRHFWKRKYRAFTRRFFRRRCLWFLFIREQVNVLSSQFRFRSLLSPLGSIPETNFSF